MKIIFAGTPDFAASALAALVKEHEVLAVLTQPDRPSGRGMLMTASPVKQLALKYAIPVMQPATLKNEETQKELAALSADLMVVAAYGLILPASVLQLPRLGCINIHASLLPRWRGAAPIQRAILAGNTETGITIMQMDAGLDTGDMLLKKHCAITPDDTAQSLHDKLAGFGASLIVEALEQLEKGQLPREKQDESQATYATKLSKMEAQLDWSNSAEQLEKAVRGYFPYPVAYSGIRGIPVKILRARVQENTQVTGTPTPGTILSIDKKFIQVVCGKGVLSLEIMQKPGGKALPVVQFVQGFPLKNGDCFGLN